MDMKKQIILVKTAGGITLFFTVFHILFYWLFNWKVTLQCLDKDTWAIFLAFNIIMNVMFSVFTILSFFYTKKLIEDTTGRIWMLFMASIYIIRIFCEFTLWHFSWTQSPIIIGMCIVPAILYLFPVFYKK